MPALLNQGQIVQAALQLEDAAAEDILAWAVESFYPRLTMATAFGAEGCLIIHMLARINPNVRVFNLETGYQFPETLQLRERIKQRYGMEVEYVRADESVEDMEKRFGGPIYGKRPDECCRIRKVEPLKKAVEGYDAWISSIRRDQTPERAGVGVVSWDRKFNLVKISPLARWTSQQVWDYIRANDVPYNPLHDRGFPSIGCYPCTRAVAEGEDERSGRWAGFEKRECGLHLQD